MNIDPFIELIEEIIQICNIAVDSLEYQIEPANYFDVVLLEILV